MGKSRSLSWAVKIGMRERALEVREGTEVLTKGRGAKGSMGRVCLFFAVGMGVSEGVGKEEAEGPRVGVGVGVGEEEVGGIGEGLRLGVDEVAEGVGVGVGEEEAGGREERLGVVEVGVGVGDGVEGGGKGEELVVLDEGEGLVLVVGEGAEGVGVGVGEEEGGGKGEGLVVDEVAVGEVKGVAAEVGEALVLLGVVVLPKPLICELRKEIISATVVLPVTAVPLRVALVALGKKRETILSTVVFSWVAMKTL
jgi:hypothetical protein